MHSKVELFKVVHVVFDYLFVCLFDGRVCTLKGYRFLGDMYFLREFGLFGVCCMLFEYGFVWGSCCSSGLFRLNAV